MNCLVFENYSANLAIIGRQTEMICGKTGSNLSHKYVKSDNEVTPPHPNPKPLQTVHMQILINMFCTLVRKNNHGTLRD